MFLISFLTALLVSHPQLSHIAPASSHPPSLMPRRVPRTERLTGISPSPSCCFLLFVPCLLSILIAAMLPCAPPPPPACRSIRASLSACLLLLKRKEKERETLSSVASVVVSCGSPVAVSPSPPRCNLLLCSCRSIRLSLQHHGIINPKGSKCASLSAADAAAHNV